LQSIKDKEKRQAAQTPKTKNHKLKLNMRKVTNEIANAFAQGESKAVGNTWTDGQTVYLHGNKITERTEDGIFMTLAGWNTTTTRERLNGIAQVLGFDISFNQKDFEPYLNGSIVNPTEWVKVS